MFALRGFTIVAALAVASVMAGCASDVKLDDSNKPPVENRNISPDANSARGAGAAQSNVANVDLGRGANADQNGMQRIVYFDFDSYTVKDEYRPIIEAHAKLLNADRNKKEVIEGHTDERGGSEYNLALGQKRA